MKKFNKFYFHDFEFDLSSLEAKFHYSFDNDVFFEEIIYFDCKSFSKRKKIDLDVINNILFHMHIALWISYYKAYPTSELIVESWILDNAQINFWKNFYINWLWEYLYRNNIKPTNLFNFKVSSNKNYKKIDFESSEKSLVALWWWKDSIFSMELLENSWLEYDLCVFWKSDSLKDSVAKTAWKEILLINRKISNNLFELNKNWYYNWHVPITWLIAFVLEGVSYIYDYKYIVLSNEKSANYWNTKWEWLEINHQYSKSLEFEKDFEEYVRKYITIDVKYFSLLRWFYEIKIAEEFSKLWKKYFNVFSSCNNNFKILKNTNSSENEWLWCNKCPKCLFVFTILRSYLTSKEVVEIFWEDLYYRRDLEKVFRELLWISWIKPFECVWESEEMVYSMYKSLNFYNENEYPYILDIFKKELLIKLDNNKLKKIEKKLVTIDDEDIIPSDYKWLILKKYIN